MVFLLPEVVPLTGRDIEMSLDRRRELLGQTMGFERLDRTRLTEAAGLTFGRSYEKGEFIFHEGDRAELFMAVVSGLVKATKCSPSGNTFTPVVAGRGSTLNSVVVLDGRPRFLTAQAMSRVEVLCLQGADFRRLTAAWPEIALDIISILGRLVESSYDRIIDLVSERVDQRLLNVLYMLLNKFGPELNFTNAELADLAGTTTETTIRVMSLLREEGIIQTGRGRVTITDPDRLQNLSRGPFML